MFVQDLHRFWLSPVCAAAPECRRRVYHSHCLQCLAMSKQSRYNRGKGVNIVMRVEELGALQTRLEEVVRQGWRERDPDVQVSSVLRDGNKIDMTVISKLFAGLEGREREALFWPVFDPVPKYDLLYMTYCLLLTPEEAVRIEVAPSKDNTDDWA